LDAFVQYQAPAKAWLASNNVVVLAGGEPEWGGGEEAGGPSSRGPARQCVALAAA
jgi:hypothetical protein